MEKKHLVLFSSHSFLYAMLPALLAVVLMTFISCSDDELASAIDNKPMPFTSYSTTTKPGDDFYEYCSGTWFESANYDDCLLYQAIDINDERVAKVQDNNSFKIYADNLDKKRLTQEGKEATSMFVQQWLDRVKATVTKDAALTCLIDVFYRTLHSPHLQVYCEDTREGIILPHIIANTTVEEIEEWFESEQAKGDLKIVKDLHEGTHVTIGKGAPEPIVEQCFASILSLGSQDKLELRRQPASRDLVNRYKVKTPQIQATRASSGNNRML